MNEIPELTLESCWTIPNSWMKYLDEGCIVAEFKNNSDHMILIEDVSCEFQTEEGLVPYEAHPVSKVAIKPHNRGQTQIPFVVELSLLTGTNVYSFAVRYRNGESSSLVVSQESLLPLPHSIIIYPTRQTEKYFFISHKIPEDSANASELDHHLRKVGFSGFRAESDLMPGLDVWKDKIIPAIRDDNCVGVIALWTSEAIANPEALIREIQHARDCNKKQILLLEDGVKLPDSFPGNTEYQKSIGRNITELDLIRLVKSIDQTYKIGRL